MPRNDLLDGFQVGMQFGNSLTAAMQQKRLMDMQQRRDDLAAAMDNIKTGGGVGLVNTHDAGDAGQVTNAIPLSPLEQQKVARGESVGDVAFYGNNTYVNPQAAELKEQQLRRQALADKLTEINAQGDQYIKRPKYDVKQDASGKFFRIDNSNGTAVPITMQDASQLSGLDPAEKRKQDLADKLTAIQAAADSRPQTSTMTDKDGNIVTVDRRTNTAAPVTMGGGASGAAPVQLQGAIPAASRIGDTEMQKIAAYDDMEQRLLSLQGEFAKSPGTVGPIAGRWADLKAKTIGNAPEETALLTDLNQMKAQKLHEMYGARLTGTELGFASKYLPDETTNAKNFPVQINSALGAIRQQRAALIDSLRRGGKNVSAYDSGPSTSAPQSAAPKTAADYLSKFK